MVGAGVFAAFAPAAGCRVGEAEGEAAFRPRSRRPHGNPQAISPELEKRIIRLRKNLTKKGLDARA